MDDITTYIYLTHIKHLHGLKPRPLIMFLAQNNDWITPYVPYEEVMTTFNRMPPRTLHVAQALARMGFSPTAICEMLEISKQAVSQHLNKRTKTTYMNGLFRHLVYGKVDYSVNNYFDDSQE
jgi:hypothetical protein